MRTITRNVLLVILAVVVLLLALGAVPSLLKSGDPYYVTATQVSGDHPAVNASDLSARRFEYVSSALDSADNGTGVSKPYWKGPIGVKGAFANSPFDEFSSLRMRHANATDGSAIYVRENATLYRMNVTQHP